MKTTKTLIGAGLLVLLSIGGAYAQANVSHQLPSMTATNPAPAQVQSTTGGFFNQDDLIFVQLINKERTDRGLQRLRLFHYSGTNQAAVWSKSMADTNKLKHASDIAFGISVGWRVTGENVGVGGVTESQRDESIPHNLIEDFMDSPSHKANILKPEFNAVVSASYSKTRPNGVTLLYTTHRFIELVNPTTYGFAPNPFKIGDKYCTIMGTNGADTIQASPSDVVFGFAGNDTISGARFVVAGRGHDRITGTSSADRLYGQGGWDKIYGLGGADKLYGGPGKDNIRGHAGNDLIYGGYNDDIIYGHSGNDTIYGQKGSDKIYGGAGRDTIYPGPQGDTNTVQHD